MNEKIKFDYLIDKGYFATEDGRVIGVRGKSVGCLKNGYYIFSTIIDKKLFLIRSHRFIYYYFNRIIPIQVDHINGIKDDNRLINLRNVTNQQNAFNTKAKGYYWNKRDKKWKSQIKLNSKSIYLGLFDTEQEARQAYLEAKETYHMFV
jgi:hypothetical protein